MRYDQQHRPSRSDPEYTRHPLGLPVSFARSYSTPTESSFPAEASDSLQQFASPHSKRNLFNSAAIYNSWIGSLHSTPSHHRRHSQQLEHRPVDLLPYRRPAYDRHPANQDHLGHVVDYGPSTSASARRASYHYSLHREDAPAYEDNAPARHHHSVTPQKGKVRRKQGPSVKKTEVGMACQFCRRRQVSVPSFEGR
jgi:peptide methionine sulfoxide reductase MsrB